MTESIWFCVIFPNVEKKEIGSCVVRCPDPNPLASVQVPARCLLRQSNSLLRPQFSHLKRDDNNS